MSRLLRPGRYANVTATLSLIVALSGTAYAASKIDSQDIANGQVKRADLGKGAVTTGKVRDGSLLKKDFKAGQLPTGRTGPKGAAGAAGAPGPAGAKGDPGVSGATDPVAVVNVRADGTLLAERHTTPATGAPTSTRGGTGFYYVTIPGVDFYYEADAAVCTAMTGSLGDVRVTTSSNNRAVYVGTRGADGALTDAAFSCAIYELK